MSRPPLVPLRDSMNSDEIADLLEVVDIIHHKEFVESMATDELIELYGKITRCLKVELPGDITGEMYDLQADTLFTALLKHLQSEINAAAHRASFRLPEVVLIVNLTIDFMGVNPDDVVECIWRAFESVSWPLGIKPRAITRCSVEISSNDEQEVQVHLH